ncbi:thioredoxin family protein [Falsibacillus pallidus]|uniref:Thioredoxin-like protein n=1 Tax=Falsibacillus pallidus TaxID=493781 RepID=A0A370G8B0_9BACI|nr:thioredoxin family protein [Falsibacillus pallidus]RDI40028.1 thioredoxin-like protein [Falsibacillus pallidus]
MTLNNWFEKGMKPKDYIDSMQVHKENLQMVYEGFNIPEGDRSLWNSVAERGLRVIVLTEDWCGDAMVNVPILMKIAEAADIEMSLLSRDQNLELMDQYLTNGTSRAIPIFIFINAAGEEEAVWGPRAPKVQEFVDQVRADMPDKEAPDFKEKQQKMIQTLTNKYTADRSVWETVYESIKEKIK